MQTIIIWIFLLLSAFLFVAQVISSLNFRLAQKLGIQEDPDKADSLLQTAEQYTAYWDLLTLGWMPLSCVLILIDSSWWPIVGLIGGAIYLDASGREAAKMLSFKKEGVKLGPELQQKLFMASYVVMAGMGFVLIALSIVALNAQ